MTDEELLKLAAKAAGLTHHETLMARDGSAALMLMDGSKWNPLTDDGDALRLIARLRLTLDYRPGFVGVCEGFRPYIGQCPHDEDQPNDTAATRRAIVMAAANLGKALA